jgi:hypothetical protein
MYHFMLIFIVWFSRFGKLTCAECMRSITVIFRGGSRFQQWFKWKGGRSQIMNDICYFDFRLRIFHSYGHVIIACGRQYARRSGPLSKERDLVATWGLSFSDLIQRTTPFSRLLRHTRGMWNICPSPDSHGSPFSRLLRHERGCWGTVLIPRPSLRIVIISTKNYNYAFILI